MGIVRLYYKSRTKKTPKTVSESRQITNREKIKTCEFGSQMGKQKENIYGKRTKQTVSGRWNYKEDAFGNRTDETQQKRQRP